MSFGKRPCAMYKDHAVGNVVAETGRDLVFGTTARLIDLSISLTGGVRRSSQQSARQPMARSGKFVSTTCIFADGVGLWKDEGPMLSPIVEHIFFLKGVRGKGEIWRAIQQWNTKDQLPKPQICDRAVAQIKQHIPEQPGGKNSKYWANTSIGKRNQTNTKNYWK